MESWLINVLEWKSSEILSKQGVQVVVVMVVVLIRQMKPGVWMNVPGWQVPDSSQPWPEPITAAAGNECFALLLMRKFCRLLTKVACCSHSSCFFLLQRPLTGALTLSPWSVTRPHHLSGASQSCHGSFEPYANANQSHRRLAKLLTLNGRIIHANVLLKVII